MAILNLDDLQKTFSTNIKRPVRLSEVVDLADSLYAIGGTMYLDTDTPLQLTTAWQPFQWFSNSIDTKGLIEDLSNGLFTVQPGAGGLYKVIATVGILSTFAGWVQIMITKNGGSTPYISKRTLVSGVSGNIGVLGSGNIQDNEVFGLAIRASGAATVTGESGQFLTWR